MLSQRLAVEYGVPDMDVKEKYLDEPADFLRVYLRQPGFVAGSTAATILVPAGLLLVHYQQMIRAVVGGDERRENGPLEEVVE